MAKTNIQITQDFWNTHPEIQQTHKVGDMLEVDDAGQEFTIPGAPNIVGSAQGSGSELLDSLGKKFERGAITAETKELTLSSGAVATIKRFKGSDVTKAQRYLSDNPLDAAKMDFFAILISLCVSIDGKAITPEDYAEMDGFDALELMGEFGGARFRKP